MSARLGDVIWWTCLGASILSALAALIVGVDPGDDANIWIPRYVIFAIGAPLFGRAVRYVLAGR